MKILLLDHPQFTHGTWMLYEGIVRIFGRDAITLFPPKPCFYGLEPPKKLRLLDTRWYRDVYKSIESKKLPNGIPPFAPGEMLTSLDPREGFGYHIIDYNNVISDFPDKSYQQNIDEDEVAELINKHYYDFIILGNGHRVPTIALARLRSMCKELPPIVYFDPGERDEFNAHWWHVFHPNITFKQTLTPQIMAQIGTPQVPCEMFPLPLSHPTTFHDRPISYHRDDSFFTNRQIDVISSFGPTWPARTEVQHRVEQTCSKLSMVGHFNAILNGYNAEQLSNTKISVSMRGSGRDTERYWEMPHRGCAMVCDGTMGCIHPFPFRDKESAVFYRNLDEVESSIMYLLNDEENRIRIAKNGCQLIHKYHSIEGRAMFFIGILKEKLGINLTTIQASKIQEWYDILGWNSHLPEWRGEVSSYD